MEFFDIIDEYGHKTGKQIMRGQPFQEGEYHLIVDVWIVDFQGNMLISKRSPGKMLEGLWEPTTGCVKAGEDSLPAAIREVKEELGLTLNPADATLYLRHRCPSGLPYLRDVWVFRTPFDLHDVVLQEGETCDAKSANFQEILDMVDRGAFMNRDVLPYIDGLMRAIQQGTLAAAADAQGESTL